MRPIQPRSSTSRFPGWGSARKKPSLKTILRKRSVTLADTSGGEAPAKRSASRSSTRATRTKSRVRTLAVDALPWIVGTTTEGISVRVSTSRTVLAASTV